MSLPHTLSIYWLVPLPVLCRLESSFANFLLGRYDGQDKNHLISWSNLSQPIDVGGVGFRKLFGIYRALQMKLCWFVMHSQSLWADSLIHKIKNVMACGHL